MSQTDLNNFNDLVSIAVATRKDDKEVPSIEVPRRIVEYFNAGNLKGFDDVGYFIHRGVKVYELGKKLESERRDGMSIEEKNFGRK